jgi:hypothetical protein
MTLMSSGEPTLYNLPAVYCMASTATNLQHTVITSVTDLEKIIV